MTREIALAILAEVCTSLASSIADLARSVFDRVGFDSDWISRQNEIARIAQSLSANFESRGIPVNIAVWNAYLNVSEEFEHILVSSISRHGNGGGFRVVVFQGNGSLTNRSEGGYSNWRCYSSHGNLTKTGNTINFGSVNATQYYYQQL
jgi:hypothetical protein